MGIDPEPHPTPQTTVAQTTPQAPATGYCQNMRTSTAQPEHEPDRAHRPRRAAVARDVPLLSNTFHSARRCSHPQQQILNSEARKKSQDFPPEPLIAANRLAPCGPTVRTQWPGGSRTLPNIAEQSLRTSFPPSSVHDFPGLSNTFHPSQRSSHPQQQICHPEALKKVSNVPPKPLRQSEQALVAIPDVAGEG